MSKLTSVGTLAFGAQNGKPLEGRNLVIHEARPRTTGGIGQCGRRDRS
jgi:hypothetical protein